MDDATLALSLARARMAIGATAIIAPGLSTRILCGRRATGVERMLARMVGARDLVLGLGTVVSLDRGVPVRGWLEGSAVSDVADCISAVLGRESLKRSAVVGTVLVSGAAAALCGVLSERLDPAPAAHPHQPEAVVTGHPDR
jgi:hypothetical protein